MTVNIDKKGRRIDEEEEKQKLHSLSISQSLNNKQKKKRRISAQEKGSYTQQYLSHMFPHDIMLDILSRLPAKLLMRFRSVSKSWNYLIRKDQSFINMHLSHSKPLQHEKMILIDRYSSYRLYTLDYNQGSNRLKSLFHRNSRLRHILMDGNYIWGTCNGLIYAGATTELGLLALFIFNPSTEEYRKIPRLDVNVNIYYSDCYGFGYNPNDNDYVVVKLVSCQTFLSTVHIYSLRNNSWKKIQDIPYVVNDNLRPGELLYGSSLHWVVHSKFIDPEVPHLERYETKDNIILAFEITTEKFDQVPCPNGPHGIMFVGQYQGKLCLYHDREINLSFDFWVMNEYKVRESWSKLFTIQKSHFNFFCFTPGVLCSTSEGYILMYLDNHLLLYDPKQKTRRHIPNVNSFGAVNFYVPSIVPLDFN